MRGLLGICFLIGHVGFAQVSSSIIFAHNDYAKQVPFEHSYGRAVGFIEADIFLKDNDLVVAHDTHEISPERTLEKMYLKPLQEKVMANLGWVYADTAKSLTLMIDLKSEGTSTVHALVEKLRNYQTLLSCRKFFITISGNVPPPTEWSAFPAFITFDGRPDIRYTQEQLQRVRLISDNYGKYAAWKGVGEISDLDAKALKRLVDDTHSKGKLLRLWASPDNTAAWQKWRELGIDIINTDKVEAVLEFFGN